MPPEVYRHPPPLRSDVPVEGSGTRCKRPVALDSSRIHQESSQNDHVRVDLGSKMGDFGLCDTFLSGSREFPFAKLKICRYATQILRFLGGSAYLEGEIPGGRFGTLKIRFWTLFGVPIGSKSSFFARSTVWPRFCVIFIPVFNSFNGF